MFFTSYQFIFLFLPATFVCFLIAHRFGGWNWAINLLGIASLAFYGFFGVKLLLILMASIAFNYMLGNAIAALKDHPTIAKQTLLFSIATNLVMLGYLKYSNFFVDIANKVADAGFAHFDLVAPIGVSFFTFIQIGYLIDANNQQLVKHNFSHIFYSVRFFHVPPPGLWFCNVKSWSNWKTHNIRLLNCVVWLLA